MVTKKKAKSKAKAKKKRGAPMGNKNNPRKPAKITLQCRFTPTIHERLSQEAQEREVSMNEVVRIAVDKYYEKS